MTHLGNQAVLLRMHGPHLVDLLATCVNNGWRTQRGAISGNGTDPNWRWGPLVAIEGQTLISCSIQGYSTVASIVYYNSSQRVLAYLSGSTVSLSDAVIPSGAAYVAVCCRNQQNYSGQYCIMR